MVQYIYFVKCPNCEDEPFDFFDEAKAFALSCLGNKPVITQVEVCRNDFGECTDSIDHGIQWSWEDEVSVTDEEPAVNVFTKGDFAEYNPDNDPEFNVLNNSVEYEPTLNTDDTAFHSDDSLDQVPDNFRKPIPEGMTIEQLVEEMEENEDMVECKWCQELFPKDEGRFETGFGGLICRDCQNAAYARGERMTYQTDSYWDFLDEDADPQDIPDVPSKPDTKDLAENLIWTCLFNEKEIGTVTAATEEEALEKMQAEYPELPYGESDGCFAVYVADSLNESIDFNELVELYYDALTTTVYGNQRDADDWDEEEYTSDYTYKVSKGDIATAIWESFITEEDVADVPGGLEALEDDAAWEKFLDTHFEDLFEKYYYKLLDHFEYEAQKAFDDGVTWEDYSDNQKAIRADMAYDEWRGK